MNTIMKMINKLRKLCSEDQYLALVSLISTPFIIFVITSAELYLKNRIDLDNKLIVLAPFLALFILTLAIGYLIYYHSLKSKSFKLFLFAYYLAGPAFLFYSAMRHSPINDLVKLLIFFISFGSVLLYLYKKSEIAKIVKFFVWFSLIVAISELVIIVNGVINAAKADNQKNTSEAAPIKSLSGKKLPNIYHIIFDEFQTDMFDLTLDQSVRNQLSGFTYYPENTTVYGRTGMSFPSIFTGLYYDYKMPQLEYQKQAFNSDKSLLFWLKKDGYETNAYIHKVYTFDLGLFDSVIEHKKNTSIQPQDKVYIKLFLNLWAYANTPEAFAKKIIKSDSLDQIKNQNLLPNIAPIISYESFEKVLSNEELLKTPNQYLFMHLILPHFPYVLKNDCSYDSNIETSPLEQSKCATKMIGDFLNTLKKIGKFDDSLIVIQSDHGARFKMENNNLIKVDEDYYSEEWSAARARALLLIKTPDKKSIDPMVISRAETSLLDITPTVLDAIGFEANLNTEGISLVGTESLPMKRSRYYHFFEKKGKNEMTDELSRYIIEEGNIKFEKKIPLEGQKNTSKNK